MNDHYFVGGGIASLAGAAYAIRDGGVDGSHITIFESSVAIGGALDAHGDSLGGYYMSGSRMFEEKYNCTFDLLSSIPSTGDPRSSVTDEMNRAEAEVPWNNKARLVNRNRKIMDAHELGFDERDRIDLVALMATPEAALDSKSIDDRFESHFFTTNFWFEWCTLFAFQRWHSAIEFRRYLLRFIHHFATIDTQAGVFRTRYNQYDSMVVPLSMWLRDRGVTMRFDVTVEDLGFSSGSSSSTVDRIDYSQAGVSGSLAIAESDCVYVTNGSMTANKRFGSMSRAPDAPGDDLDASWNLWHRLAAGRPQFGDPSAFDDHVGDSMWESFTVTVDGPLFFDLMRGFSGSDAGEGGLITFVDSSWLITLSIFHQPFFSAQPKNVYVWWGYGLFHDRPGDYVKKTMAECTGSEILEEVLGHLGFDGDSKAILAASNVIPCSMPFITSQFLKRKAGDRPRVVPHGSKNLAFIGQFSEVPADVVFTVEYSIRSAQAAVYGLLRLDRTLTPMYEGWHDPRVLLEAFETLHR